MAEQQTEQLEWRVWPAREKVITAAVVIAVILLSSLAALKSFQNGWYGFLSLAGLTLALAEWLFPTHYRLDETGVRVRGPFVHTVRDWEAFRLAVVLPDRILLSPLSNLDSWIARRRRVVLRLRDNAVSVREFVGRRVELRDQA